MVAARSAHRLADPSREIPPGIALRVIATSGVKKSLLGFVPAALVLMHVHRLIDTGPRLAALLLAAVFLALGVGMALYALARAARALRMMRHGFQAEGKIVSCRLASEGSETPYADFLPNWMVHQTRPQIRGFKWTIVGIFVAPLAVFALVGGAILMMRSFGPPPFMDAGTSQALAVWAAALAVFALLVAGVVSFARRPEAKEPIVAPPLVMDPLPPESYAGLALYCTVEYLAGGERRTSKGRVLLSSRLNRSGAESLLYPASGKGSVVFLAGLPHEARVDASGQWQAAGTSERPIGLIITAVIAGASLGGFAAYVPWLLAAWRLQPA